MVFVKNGIHTEQLSRILTERRDRSYDYREKSRIETGFTRRP
jgi:hypothetical protein